MIKNYLKNWHFDTFVYHCIRNKGYLTWIDLIYCMLIGIKRLQSFLRQSKMCWARIMNAWHARQRNQLIFTPKRKSLIALLTSCTKSQKIRVNMRTVPHASKKIWLSRPVCLFHMVHKTTRCIWDMRKWCMHWKTFTEMKSLILNSKTCWLR